jgi:hypothetical protein
MYMNPAEFVIDLISTDFSHDDAKSTQRLDHLHTSWKNSQSAEELAVEIARLKGNSSASDPTADISRNDRANPILVPLTLIHRSFIKSYRDVVTYGIRIAMYMGLAIMMGTVWLRLAPVQSNIQAFTNAIFFGGAFMSFMAVAYIPAFIEDLHLYKKERANGLYGPTAFMIANFIVGLPIHHHDSILGHLVLARQLPTHGSRVLDLGNVAFPRPTRCGIPGSPSELPNPHLRCRTRSHSIRQRSLDVCEWLYGATRDSECLLALRLSLH